MNAFLAVIIALPLFAWTGLEGTYDRKALLRAEGSVKGGDLAGAAQILEGLLAVFDQGIPPRGNDLAQCLRQLSAVYRDLHRHEDAVRVSLRYGDMLEKTRSADALRENHLFLATQYIHLGHGARAIECLTDALNLADAGYERMHPIVKLHALIQRGKIHDAEQSPERASADLAAARTLCEQLIQRRAAGLQPADFVEVVQQLAYCHWKLGNAAEGIRLLEGMLARAKPPLDSESRLGALALLSSICLEQRLFPQAEKHAREALTVAEKSKSATPFQVEETRMQLAEILARAGKPSNALGLYRMATESLRRELTLDPADPSVPMEVQQQLQLAYQRLHNVSEASRLAEARLKRLAPDSLAFHDLRADLAVLYVLSGEPDKGRLLLREEVEYRKGRRETDPISYLRLLKSLASAELAARDAGRAKEWADEAIEFHKAAKIPDDLLLAELLDARAMAALSSGRYDEAVARFEEAAGHAEKLQDEKGERVHAQILLNLATAYHSQGLVGEAFDSCRRSMEIERSVLGSNAVELLPHYRTMASLVAASGDLDGARAHATRALEICRSNALNEESATAMVHELLAKIDSRAERYPEAEGHWRQALAIYEGLGQSEMVARMLLYLARSAELREDLVSAEQCSRRSLELLDRGARTPPVLKYLASSILSSVLMKQGKSEQARDMLLAAVDLVEDARATTWGAEKERADYFAQFASGFDTLVEWTLREGNVDEAVAVAERGRNRTFLDQLRLAGADPRSGLEGTDYAFLLDRERELDAKIQAIDAEARRAASNPGGSVDLEKWNSRRETEEKKYVENRTKILNASPAYRGLLRENQSKTPLADLHDNLGGDRAVVLYYYLGKESSYLMALDSASGAREHWRLEVPPDVWAEFDRDSDDALPALVRAPGSVVKGPKAAFGADVREGRLLPKGPLTAAIAAELVSAYMQPLRSGRSAGVRAPGKIVQSPKGNARGGDLAVLANILLPFAARDFLATHEPEYLILVPDGALHQLSFEALLLEETPEVKFVLDELPPIAYAPSVSVLLELLQRQQRMSEGEFSLLTVGDPEYGETSRPVDDADFAHRRRGAAVSHYLGVGGQFKRLPGTKAEMDRLSKAFEGYPMVRLTGAEATEANVVGNIGGRRIVHLASHGLVDERHQNLFGSIVLAPPAHGVKDSRDDGFLQLREVHHLPLRDCRLAVLSACDTNVGPDRPMEAGSSLARAFLASGASRVVSSLWSVGDESTAELMGEFFDLTAENIKANDPVTYAKNLHAARTRIRAQRKYSSPYYWAPFILVGPPTERPVKPSP